MARRAWLCLMLVFMVAMGMVFGLRTAAPAAPIVKGDRAAWSEIVAAFRKLNAPSGYRVRIKEFRRGNGYG